MYLKLYFTLSITLFTSAVPISASIVSLKEQAALKYSNNLPALLQDIRAGLLNPEVQDAIKEVLLRKYNNIFPLYVAQQYKFSDMLALTFVPDANKALVATRDGVEEVDFATNTVRTVVRFPYPFSPIEAAFSPDGNYVVTVSGTEDHNVSIIRLWDLGAGNTTQNFVQMDAFLSNVDLSPDGKSVLVTSKDTMYLWSIDDLAAKPRVFQESTMNILSLAFSSDSTYLITGSWNGKVHLWDLSTGNSINVYTQDQPIWSVAFSPDGNRIALGLQGVAHLLDRETGKIIKTFQLQDSERIRFLTFSPDGRYLLIGSGDYRTSYIWDVTTGTRIATLKTKGVTAALFGSDLHQGYLLVGSNDDILYLVNLNYWMRTRLENIVRDIMQAQQQVQPQVQQ